MSHHFSFLFIYLFFHITFLRKVHLVKAMVFPVVKYGCESWTIKKAEHRRTDAFELWFWTRLSWVPWTTWISNQSNPKGNQPWLFIERTYAEAEAPILLPLDAMSQIIRKDPDVGKDWGQSREGGDRGWDGWMVHWLNGHEFEQTLRDSERQGSLMCCNPRGRKESDTTGRLNNKW